MFEPMSNTVKIADTIPIGILKGARVYLIDDRATPPVSQRGIWQRGIWQRKTWWRGVR